MPRPRFAEAEESDEAMGNACPLSVLQYMSNRVMVCHGSHPAINRTIDMKDRASLGIRIAHRWAVRRSDQEVTPAFVPPVKGR